MESQSPNPKNPSLLPGLYRPFPDLHESSKPMNNLLNQQANPPIVISPNFLTLAPPEGFRGAEPDPDLEPEPEPEWEYCCKYCNKKFTSKQALAGHHNSHKLERAIKKTPQGVQGIHLGYYGGPSPYRGLMVGVAVPPLHGSFNTFHDFLNVNAINRPHIPPQPLHFQHPVVPMANDLYTPHPIPGVNHSPPRFFQFIEPFGTYVPNRIPTPHLAYMGQLGSSSGMPVSEGLPNSGGSRSFVLGWNVGGRNGIGPENHLEEGSGLDLSLKL